MESKNITNEQFMLACELSLDLHDDNDEIIQKCKDNDIYDLTVLIKQHVKLTEELTEVDNKINQYTIIDSDD